MNEEYFNKILELHRPIKQDLGGGAWKESFSKVREIQGRLRPLSGREQYLNQQKQKIVNYRFYCGYDVDIQETDILVDPTSAVNYEISFVKNPMMMNDHLEIDLIQ